MPVSIFRALAVVAGISLLSTTSLLAQEGGMPPASVGVVMVQPESIPVTSELPGRVSATQVADVRPRVGGIIETRVFEQGSLVTAGDVLFRLDSASYEIAVEAAKASVARAEAVLAEAEATERRYASLNERNITSQAEFETATATRLQAAAALAEAKAQLRAAEINLSYTEVKAPISGRIGRAQVTEGALVSAQGEVLTTIQQLDPVYADMQQPVSELLRLRQALDSGELTQVEPGAARVVLLLDDGSQYAHPGKLLFAEASVERSSGQVTLRAEFPNPDGILLPGMYVRVSVEQATEAAAFAIPGQAVQRDASGKAMVYVVTNGAAELRTVGLGRSVGNRVTVHEGLTAGDMLIVDGFQKMGPGAPVSPVCWADPSTGDTPPDVCAKALAAPAEASTN
ncbi:efflux RND transporter periplasmic adaptor subunit [Paracoccus sp. IB05]|uniref:efflux RND transporter periplasmic adaptor subunit n=1 Tax=Paracoccus sp. IB05 TaxID=2779367 RepID=UPI0018E80E75|nr:efflux RND transporter periplasmic adaptor subunit [Paracoccus sp. IB05]MBJ2149294.1 efflux RND transporter periplasmic adaptor subunit [Paracoccus sp. IB05]